MVSYVYYVVSTLFGIIASYSLLVLFANELSKEDYANYAFLTSLFSVVLIFVNIGSKDALFKFSSKSDLGNLQQQAQNALTLILFWVFVIAVSSLFFDQDYLWAGLSFCFLHALQLLLSVCRGRKHYLVDALGIPLFRITWLAAVLILFYQSKAMDVSLIFMTSALSSFFVWLILGGGHFITEVFKSGFRLSWPLKNETVRNLFFIELVTVLFMRADILILQFLGIKSELMADYFFSIQVFEAATLIIAPLSYIVFNRLNMHHSNSAPKLLLQGSSFLLVVVLTGILAWWLLGELILQFMFSKYQSTFVLIQTLLFALIPSGINLIFSYYLIAMNKEYLFVLVCAVGLLSVGLLNFILIPEFGLPGAAWARLMAEFVIAVLLIVFTIRTHRKNVRDSNHL